MLLSACGSADQVEIKTVRKAPLEARFAKPDASSSERFGGGQMAGQDHEQASEQRFTWEMPADWTELPPQQFRDVNLRPGGQSDLECYLTLLSGNGGGLGANVNRWRSQMGLAAITDDEALALPQTTLFGRPAVNVELRSEDGERSLLGVIYSGASNMATIKLTGPTMLVEEQREGFDQFRATLNVRASTASGPTAAAAGSSTASAANSGSLSYALPEGWLDAGASSMRAINLRTPGSSQCYLIRLKGPAGGLVNNLNRWRGEVGLEPFDQAAAEALPKVTLLGQECPLLEVSGEYSGMGDLAGADMTVFGVARISNDSSLFVKMVGPRSDMAAERPQFLEFLASLSGA